MKNDPKVLVEKGIVAGNVTDKYGSRNPIHRWLMDGFLKQAEALVRKTGCREVFEAGCGEGLLSMELAARVPGLRIRGTDFSEQVIAIARRNAAEHNEALEFSVADVYSLTPERHGAELVVCCEVLEHLEHPAEALRILSRLAGRYLVLSVPNEPLWRMLNMARGKYVGDWGNTPGHVNHWSSRGFRSFLERELIVEELHQPLPWTMVLARPRGRAAGV